MHPSRSRYLVAAAILAAVTLAWVWQQGTAAWGGFGYYMGLVEVYRLREITPRPTPLTPYPTLNAYPGMATPTPIPTGVHDPYPLGTPSPRPTRTGPTPEPYCPYPGPGGCTPIPPTATRTPLPTATPAGRVLLPLVQVR